MRYIKKQATKRGRHTAGVALFVLILLGTLLAQTTQIAEVQPLFRAFDPLFTLCVCYCLQQRSVTALVISAFCGLLQEALVCGQMGEGALLYLIIAWFCIGIGDGVCREKTKQTLLVVFLGSVLYSLLFWGVRGIRWGFGGYEMLFFKNILPTVFCNTAFSLFSAWLVKKLPGHRENILEAYY